MQTRSEYLGNIKKPIPYYGSKERAAPLIMDFLHGDGWANQHYEPFVGSNACIFYKHLENVKDIIINDFDGNVTNLWRSLKLKPQEVASHVLGVANTINLSALDLAVQRSYDSLLDRMHADIDYCDPKLAAHYLDLCAGWIGGGAGFTTGPWTTVKDEDGYDVLVNVKAKGEVRCKQIQYSSDRGVIAKGGVRCQQVRYSVDNGVNSVGEVRCQQAQYRKVCVNVITKYDEWFRQISERLSNARILAHDWLKIMNLHVITHKKTALILDPPYDKGGNNGGGAPYRGVGWKGGGTVSDAVRQWLIDNDASLKGTRICLCGRGTEHDELLSYGYTKMEGVNNRSLAKKKGFDENSQEWLWTRMNS